MTQTASQDIYSAPDIETNRAGRLTDDQSRFLKAQARSFSKGMLYAALFAVVIGVLLAISTGPAPNAWARPAASAACFAGALVFLFLALRPNSEAADASGGRVEAVDGPIGKKSWSTEGKSSSITSYFLEIGAKRYEVGRSLYQAAPEAGWVRVYVTPRIHKVVNFEQLPDKVVPDLATVTPMKMLGEVGKAIFARDQETRNETRAEMEAMGNAMKAQMPIIKDATPPPAAERDPRPLAQAILGKWQMGPMAMNFMPDGTMVATFMGGRQRQGHWSIGADGKLHSDATGTPGAADAWITGDTLTISQQGEAAAFQRAAN
jgi:hypothetical protein